MLQFVPSIRSGGFADIGPRRYMEDEHIRIDDLSAHLGSLISVPEPSAFYGVSEFLALRFCTILKSRLSWLHSHVIGLYFVRCVGF